MVNLLSLLLNEFCFPNSNVAEQKLNHQIKVYYMRQTWQNQMFLFSESERTADSGSGGEPLWLPFLSLVVFALALGVPLLLSWEVYCCILGQ